MRVMARRTYCDLMSLALALALALAAGTAAQSPTKMPGQGECGGKGGCQEKTPPCSSHDQCSGDFFCDFDKGQCRGCCFSAARVEGKCQVRLSEWLFCLDARRDVHMRVPC